MRHKIIPSFILSFMFLLSACNNGISHDTTNSVCSYHEDNSYISSNDESSSLYSSHIHETGTYEYDEYYHTMICQICGNPYQKERHYFGKETISDPAKTDKAGKLTRYCSYCPYSEEVEYENDDIFHECQQSFNFNGLMSDNVNSFTSNIKDIYCKNHTEKFYYIDTIRTYLLTPSYENYTIYYRSENEASELSDPVIYESAFIKDKTLGCFTYYPEDVVYGESCFSYEISSFFYPVSDFSKEVTYDSKKIYTEEYGNIDYKITCYSGEDIFGYIFITCDIKLPNEKYFIETITPFIEIYNH